MKKLLVLFTFALALGTTALNAQEKGALDLEEALFERPMRTVNEGARGNFWLPCEDEALPTLPGISEPLTASYIKRYSTGGNKKWFSDALVRGNPYLAFIKNRLAESGMPPELLYLPLIESAFVQSAVSSSGAAGLWQFMRNSMAPWLKFNEYLDERLDFWASTDAAIAKLRANYAELGDWEMSLAAYNSGLGAIRSVIKNNPGENYWRLSEKRLVKNETIQYVPKLLASYYIAENPRRMGFEDFWPETVHWARVPVGREADLRVLSELAGIPYSDLAANNAELKFKVTPSAAYTLKVRTERRDDLLAALSTTEPLVRSYTHVVAAGDTIYALARRYGVSEERIFEANPGIKERALKIGLPLSIPTPKAAGM